MKRLLLAICMAAGWAGAQTNAPLPQVTIARQKYVEQLSKIHAEHQERLLGERLGYLAELDRARAVYRQQADLDKVKAIDEEQKRFSQHRNWDLGKREKFTPQFLKPGIEKYRQEEERIRAHFDQPKAALKKSFAAHLEGIKKQLTLDNRIDEAVRVKTLIEGIDAIQPNPSSRPLMPPNREEQAFSSPDDLEAYLNQSRWKLAWVRGPIPAKPEYLEFHFGRLARSYSDSGREEKVAYAVGKDLNVSLRLARNNHRIVFDPSFTRFDLFYEDQPWPYRRGLLMQKPSSAEHSFRDDLLLYYGFDEVSRIVKDLSGRQNDGTAKNTLVAYWGKRANAYKFSSSSEIRVQKPIDLGEHENFSVSVWIQAGKEQASGRIISWLAENDKDGTFLAIRRGRLYCGLLGENRQPMEIRDKQVPAATWSHVALTHDRRGADVLYFNGNQVASRPSSPMNKHSGTVMLGGKFSDYPFVGMMDELMVFKRTLSPEDVKKLTSIGGD